MPFPYPRVAFTKQGDPAECINKASPRCLQIADLLAQLGQYETRCCPRGACMVKARDWLREQNGFQVVYPRSEMKKQKPTRPGRTTARKPINETRIASPAANSRKLSADYKPFLT